MQQTLLDDCCRLIGNFVSTRETAIQNFQVSFKNRLVTATVCCGKAAADEAASALLGIKDVLAGRVELFK